jgi:Ni/Co efflux regulator RcnB
MKKFLMALSATALVATPLIASEAQAAPHREVTRTISQGQHGRTVVRQRTVVRNDHRGYDDNRGGYNNGRGIQSHRWAKGQRFDRRYATNYRVISNYRDYRLSAPPRGYHYVRSGNDAVLVAITSGIIGAVIGSALN